MARYYGSEALRNPKIQKKALDFALDQLSPMIHNVGSQALDELSTKIRPKKNYKTNRKDLDGAGLDIHKMIGKLPKPKGGFTLPGHKYTGPYNDLDSQVRFDASLTFRFICSLVARNTTSVLAPEKHKRRFHLSSASEPNNQQFGWCSLPL